MLSLTAVLPCPNPDEPQSRRGSVMSGGGGPMITQVVIDPDGCVTVTLDTDHDDMPTELVGLTVDDMLDQAGRAAVATWIEMHCDEEAATNEAASDEQ